MDPGISSKRLRYKRFNTISKFDIGPKLFIFMFVSIIVGVPINIYRHNLVFVIIAQFSASKITYPARGLVASSYYNS